MKMRRIPQNPLNLLPGKIYVDVQHWARYLRMGRRDPLREGSDECRLRSSGYEKSRGRAPVDATRIMDRQETILRAPFF